MPLRLRGKLSKKSWTFKGSVCLVAALSLTISANSMVNASVTRQAAGPVPVTPATFHFPSCKAPMDCALGGAFPDFGQAGAIKRICPAQNWKVAYLDGQGNNQYRKIVRAEFQDEASYCPTLTAIYDNANDNETTYLSDLNSLVSQNVKVIVTYDDFGAAVLPELRAAYKKGIQVVAILTPLSLTAKAGVDYTGLVMQNNYATGQNAAKFLNGYLHGKGQLIYIGGTPGNLADGEWLSGFRSVASKGLDIVAQAEGGWTLAGNETVMLPLVSKYPKVAAIINSYTAVAAGAVSDYLAAHVPVPMNVGQADDMQNACQYWSIHRTQPSFQTWSVDGDQLFVRIGLREGVAAAEGKKDTIDPPWTDGEILIDNQPLMNSAAGIMPKCNPKYAPGFDFQSDLPASVVEKISAG